MSKLPPALAHELSEEVRAFLGADDDDPRRVMSARILDSAVAYGEAAIALVDVLALVDRDLELRGDVPGARSRIRRVVDAYHRAVHAGDPLAVLAAARVERHL